MLSYMRVVENIEIVSFDIKLEWITNHLELIDADNELSWSMSMDAYVDINQDGVISRFIINRE